MAATQFDINSLFRQAFNLGRGTPYNADEVQQVEYAQGQDYDRPSIQTGEGETFLSVRNDVVSMLPTGKPVFMPMRLGGLVLPNEPTVSIASRKNIVETALVGSTRRGTVKELIGVEDWQVTIRGIAINYNSKEFYPEDIVKGLRDLYERNEALEVQCALTRLLGIYRLVIRDFALPEMIGVQNAQAYQFTCTSDEDFILEI